MKNGSLLVVSLLTLVQRSLQDSERCLAQDKIFSPDTDTCHTPTDQGPCREDEWFVLTTHNSGEPILHAGTAL